MPRKQFDDGLEVVYQDLSQISSALELEIYDRVIYELLGRQQNMVFGDSFSVSYLSGTQVSVKAGQGFQLDNTQLDPECQNRLLYVAANTTLTITTPNASNPRIDLVCIKADRASTVTQFRNFKDAASGSVSSVSQVVESDWAADLQIVAGTPAGSPVAPATPSGWIALAQLLVSASTGIANQSAITDKRPRYRRGNKTAAKTSAYTVDVDDETVFLNASGGNFTATLPTAASCWDSTTNIAKKFTFVNIGATGNPSIAGNGSELISDNNIQLMGPQYSSLTVTTNGTQWYMI